MPTKTIRTLIKQRAETQESEYARFEASLKDFDLRHAEMEARLDALLRSMGVDPARAAERETA